MPTKYGAQTIGLYYVRWSLNQLDTILEKEAAAVIPTLASRWRGGGGRSRELLAKKDTE